jgi:tetratricopeptide (TPR) repeat protein
MMILRAENFRKIIVAAAVAFFWLIHIPLSMAQSHQEALALLKQLDNSKDTTRINILQALSRYYVGKTGEIPSDLDSADLLNHEAVALSRQLDYKPGIGRSLFLNGKIWWERKNQHKAMGQFNEGLAYANKYDLFKLRGDIDVSLGQYTNTEGSNIDKKNSYFKDALLCYKKAGAKKEEGEVLESLGDIAQMKGDFGKSVELLQRSVKVFNAIKYKEVQGDYELLCDVYRQKGDFPLALRNGLLAVKTAEDLGDKNGPMTSIYNRVALIYYDLKNNDMALQYFQKSRNSAILSKDTASIFQLSVNMSGLLL